MVRILVICVAVLGCLKPSIGQEGVKTWQKGGGGVKGGHMVALNHSTVVEDHPVGTMDMVNLHRANESQSALDRFMNKTKTAIPKGVCFEEVPTITLVKSKNGLIPAGNGVRKRKTIFAIVIF